MRRPASFVPCVVRLEDRSVPAVVGALDPTFDDDGRAAFDFGPVDELFAAAHQPNGKILVAGTTGPLGEVGGDFLVSRLNPDGKPDPTFNGGGSVRLDFGGNDVATSLAILSDGRILVGGYTEGATDTDFALARLNADGSLDTTFASSGSAIYDLADSVEDKAYSISVNAFGGIYMGGISGDNMAVLRLDPFGNLDKAYGTNGLAIADLGGHDVARAMVVHADSRVTLIGYSDTGTTENNFAAVRLSANGTQIDFGFGNTEQGSSKFFLADFGGDDKAYAAAVQSNGSIVIAGNDSGPGSDFAVARITSSGQLDPTFNGNGLRKVGFGVTDEARAVAIQPNGQILVGGFATSDRSTVADFAMVRLTPDGADDPTFGPSRRVDFGGDDRINALSIDSSGRVVIVGRKTADSAVARLNGTVGSPSELLVTGTVNGSGRRFTPMQNRYISGTDYAVFPGFTGVIRSAAADVNGDGVADLISGAGPGGGPSVAVYDGATGALLSNFFAFESSFIGGVLVAAGDFNGDARADLVVTADIGGGPRVKIIDGNSLTTNTPQTLADFFGIADTDFRGGARPAVGDINADGVADLVIVAGPGGGPRVAVFDGRSIVPGSTPFALVPDFFVFEPALRDGAYPAVGDVDGDGFADLVFGAGTGGGPRVRVIGGQPLMHVGAFTDIEQVVGLQIVSFFAGDVNARAGVRVAVRDIDGDNRADVVTGSGPNLQSEVRIYRGTTLQAGGEVNPDQAIDPFGAVLPDGVYVG